jgi:hypothetical protein
MLLQFWSLLHNQRILDQTECGEVKSGGIGEIRDEYPFVFVFPDL